MIEFNLVPDVKIDYLKSENVKRRVFTISMIVGLISVAIIVVLFGALELQNHQISSNNKDIKKYSDQLTGTTDINKILTIQNQLKTVVSLNKQAPDVARIYTYLPQIVPANVTIGHMTLDFTANSLKITGGAPNLETINTFADTMKFANYTTDQKTQATKAFTNVLLDSFGRDQSGATYDFSVTFDPILFDHTQKVQLSIPKDYISTRSFTGLPSDNLFKALPNSNSTGSTP